MDKLALIQAILESDSNKGDSYNESFLEVGKVYAFRSVTMIYTGRLVSIGSREFLIDEAAWIPDTERWADFVATGAHREAEPYTKKVTLNRDALLDVTQIPAVITKQK